MEKGNEFLENAIESKRQADRKRAILLAISISTTLFVIIFVASYIGAMS